MSGTARLILAWVVGFAALPAWCQSIDVLWYAYADPSSVYIQMRTSSMRAASEIASFPARECYSPRIAG